MRFSSLATLALVALLAGCDDAADPNAGIPPDASETSSPDGSTNTDCSAATCAGCCLPDGVCAPGDERARCGTGGSACADCGAQGTCSAGGTCSNAPDAATPPPNDKCAGAARLTFANDTATANGDTRGASQDGPAGCFPGRDVFYEFTTTDVTNTQIAVSPTSANVSVGLLLLSGSCGAQVRDCAEASESGAKLVLNNLPAGTYTVAVRTDAGHDGAFRLTVTAKRSGLPKGESCANPASINFVAGANGSRVATITDDIDRFTQEDRLDCVDGWNITHDASYGFSLTEPTRVKIELKQPSGAVTYVRLLRADCVRDNSIACDSGTDTFPMRPMDFGALAAGDYRITVSAFVDRGPAYFTLTITLSPAQPGDSCSNPVPLDIPATGGTVTVKGDTTSYAADVPNKCGGTYDRSTCRDAVYSFATQAPMDFAASAKSTTTGFSPRLLLRHAADCAKETDIQCAGAISGTATLNRKDLPAGDYVLVVDAAPPNYTSDKVGGAYDLTVTLTAQVPGDRCSTAQALAFSNGAAGGTASASGSSAGMGDDLAGCVTYGRDAVFSFTTDRTLNLSATLTGGTMLGLKQSSCEGYQTYLCGDDDLDAKGPTLLAGGLPAGTWWIVADGLGASYTLDATLSAPKKGDGCADPLPLTFSNGAAGGAASASGDLGGFFDDPMPCIGQYAAKKADVAYRFTTSKPLNLTASITDGSGGAFKGTLSLSADCAGSGRLECGGTSLSAGGLAPGNWVLVVDGEGPYRIDATLTEPKPGDGCANPIALFPAGQASGTVTVPVDLTGLFDDHAPTCRYGSSPDRDVFYSFTTTAPASLRASAKSSTTPGASIYLLDSGCKAPELACTSGDYSTATAIERETLSPGSYLIGVDSANANPSLTLTATVAPPAPGENCGNAIPLSFPNGANGGVVTVSGDTTSFFDSLQSTCAASGGSTRGRDVVYTFTTAAKMNLEVSIKSLTANFKPSVYHAADGASGCGYDSRMCAWMSSYSPTVMGTYKDMPAGKHYLVVDAPPLQQGQYELQVRLLPIGPGESCASPKALTFTGGAAHVDGEISSFFPDHNSNACGSQGEEAVYSFTTTSTRYATIKLSTPAASSAFAPVLYLRSGNCLSGTELTCQYHTNGSITWAGGLPAGTYFVFVDSQVAQLNTGAFSLDVTLGDPPQGDTCQNPIPLALSNGAAGGTASVTGDTTPFLPDTTPGCGGFGGAPTAVGRDVVYSFTVDRALKLTAKMTPTNGYDGVITLRSSCGGAELACQGAAVQPGARTLTYSVTAGTWFLTVDSGASGSGFPYSLEVSLVP